MKIPFERKKYIFLYQYSQLFEQYNIETEKMIELLSFLHQRKKNPRLSADKNLTLYFQIILDKLWLLEREVNLATETGKNIPFLLNNLFTDAPELLLCNYSKIMSDGRLTFNYQYKPKIKRYGTRGGYSGLQQAYQRTKK